MAWTEEAFERAKVMAADGMSATLIAAELGDGFSRCAVIGKFFRAGISLGSVIKEGKKRRPKVTIKEQPQPKEVLARVFGPERLEPIPLPPELPVERKGRLVSLMKLKSHHCRYPFGQPGEKGFGFCGARVQDDSSYCAEHHARCYQPQWAQSKARRKAEWVAKAIR